MSLKFRPHHFLCTLGFQGRGYSSEFIQNFQEISNRLRGTEGDCEKIEIVGQTDSICNPCPNKVNSSCSTEAKIRQLDHNHEKVLGLRVGQTLTWAEAKKRISERMSPEEFHLACSPCSWRELGFCEKALNDLRTKRSSLVPIILFASILLPKTTFAAPLAASSKDIRWLKSPSTWHQVSRKSIYFDHARALLARRSVERAERSLQSKRWTEAAKEALSAKKNWLMVQELFSSSPWQKKISEELGRAELVEAQAHAGLKRPSEAKVFFERAWDRLPFSKVNWKQMERYFQVCQKLNPGFWRELGKADSCANWSRRILASLPRSAPERIELGKNWQPLLDSVSNVLMPGAAPRVQQSYKSPDEDQVAWDAVVPLLRAGDLDAARDRLEEFLGRFPRSALKQKARYWLAISRVEDSEMNEDSRLLLEQIAKESPLSFYGLLSATRLGKSPEDFLLSEEVDLKPFDLRLHPSEVVALEKAQGLIEAADPRLLELAQMELREVRPNPTHESEFLTFLAELHRKAGSHLGAFATLTELIQRGAKQATTRWAADVIFPVERWAAIRENSEEKKIDPIWVLSLMKQESAFDVGALSSSGAVGLMQVMPATAVDTDPMIHRVALSEDLQNIRIGTSYMAAMLQRFRGNLALATAAYNAGPVAVERWMKELNLKDTEKGLSFGVVEFIESIPYRETRDYVGSIIRNYYWYSRRVEKELQQQILKYFWERTPQ